MCFNTLWDVTFDSLFGIYIVNTHGVIFCTQFLQCTLIIGYVVTQRDTLQVEEGLYYLPWLSARFLFELPLRITQTYPL